MDREDRVKSLKRELEDRILVVDGAMGTALQKKNLTAKDFGGAKFEGCNEHLIFSKPEVITEVHEEYLEAGADIIETNTFGGTRLVLAEYGLEKKVYEINKLGAELACAAVEKYSKITPNQPRFVAGSMGPTTKAISVTGGVTFEELVENFKEQAKALYDGGVDYFLVETCQDTRNIKAALIGINEFLSTVDVKIPIAVSGTVEASGTMLAGQTPEALVASLEHVDLLYIGLNCATGPDLMTDHIRTMASLSKTNIACVPNAGLPDEEGHYLETPEMLSKTLSKFIDHHWINVIGGCCGTHAGHIKELAEMVKRKRPRKVNGNGNSTLAGVDFLEVTDDKRPLLVGERTNVIGSKKFRDLITAKKFDEAAEIAKAQVKKGAQIIDVCLANPDSDEISDMENFLDKLIHKVKVPLMIDSTDPQVFARALTYCQGKSIINSVNLEEPDRFEKIVPLAKKFGAALVVGTIDDDPNEGMGITRQRKVEIAVKAYELLTKKYGIKESDIYWDTLVFPCGTGDEKYVGSALHTIEALREIKIKYPKSKSLLGVSNVSFGLPPAGREVLNSVFLYHCTKAGLDLAIVNTEKLKRYPNLTDEEIRLSENLLFNKTKRALDDFVAFFRDKKVSTEENKSDLPLEKRIARYIIDGTKSGLTEDLDELRKKMAPMEIINGPLMEGMKEVGSLFNSNQLIVAEVLQSAESMKTAVSHLEQFMDKNESAKKGVFLLATVKGDVHDIGKNLVDIVLSNNGYEVINLGIKITSEQLIEAIKKHKPDMVGLSGLLVKSAHEMAMTAEDLKEADIHIPIVVGGAALSEKFVNAKILPAYGSKSVYYAKDAMDGLNVVNKVLHDK